MKKGWKTLAKISKLLNVCYNVEFQVPPGLENPEKSKGGGGGGGVACFCKTYNALLKC